MKWTSEPMDDDLVDMNAQERGLLIFVGYTVVVFAAGAATASLF